MDLKRVVKECDPTHMNQLLFEATDQLESSRNSRLGRRMLEKYTEYGLCLATATLGVACVAREIFVAMAGSVAVLAKFSLHVFRVFIKPKACERAYKKLPGTESCIYRIKRIGAQTLGIGSSLIGAALFWYKGVKWDITTQKRLGNYTPFVKPEIADIPMDDDQPDEPDVQPAPDIAEPAPGIAAQKVATAPRPKVTTTPKQRVATAPKTPPTGKQMPAITPKQLIPNRKLPPTPKGKMSPLAIKKAAAKPAPADRPPTPPPRDTPPVPPPRATLSPVPPQRDLPQPVAAPPPPPLPPAPAAVLSPRKPGEQLFSPRAEDFERQIKNLIKVKDKTVYVNALKTMTAPKDAIKKVFSALINAKYVEPSKNNPPTPVHIPFEIISDLKKGEHIVDPYMDIWDVEGMIGVSIREENETVPDHVTTIRQYIALHHPKTPAIGTKIPLEDCEIEVLGVDATGVDRIKFTYVNS